MAPSHIAVVGGGITGLSSAWHLVRRFPRTPITVVEKEGRFGGWIRSERVEVDDGEGHRESMVLEAGPRTLRPQSKAILELIHLLNLEDSILTVPLSSPAAKSRFLHLPGRNGLAQLPSSFTSLLTSPLSWLIVPAIAREPFKASNRPNGATDESFDSFLSRRFGPEFARCLGSALVHGVYAADSRQLSTRAAFPSIWIAEERGNGSIIQGFLRNTGTSEEPTYDLGTIEATMKGVSVYSFKNGMYSLVDALLKALNSRPNVRLLPNTAITSLTPKGKGKLLQVVTGSETLEPSHVVAALPLPQLDAIIPSSSPLPHLTANPASSVTVMNLVFPPSPQPIHPPGFGYLIPRPEVPFPYDGKQPGILGTVFDSCSVGDQDVPLGPGNPPLKRFTKVTVMLGGPYNVTPEHISVSTVLRHLSLHLSRPLPDPVLMRVHNHRHCIPIPTVGHVERMEELNRKLASSPWAGRLQVVGAGATGVSVGDCVKAGRNVGSDW
ncbi:Protoporphyrinogen oxidase [Neolentinus lepideus HHB14362 ss-1]|uniref:Protoporphyrinogen oxidase n=1 Tax=Neolentinus lepideus HHB14362 ss-1 TaxID=1314782 RepID=A0A165STM3_9AGAM|nr:Protoporphyrinogen oxidase [Neolentinus lepideus HHB14362 ss-1]